MTNFVASNPALWRTRTPSQRAPAPEWMSFHTFKDAERCPLSTSLRNSYYASIWGKKGYPDRPNVSAVTGIVVHSCAETLIKRFAESGINSLMEPAAMAVLRDLGGFTKMIVDGLDAYVKGEQSNPRFVQCQEELLHLVRLRIPDMRATLQELLTSADWSSSLPSHGMEKSKSSTPGSAKPFLRYALPIGTHMEIDLVDASIGWRGTPDVLVVSGDDCQIVDFKTGAPDPEHQLQMQVYAMLWTCDAERNPNHIPIGKITLVYRNGPVDVPIPDDAEIAALRRTLIEQTADVKRKLNSNEVPAKPSTETCRYCQVKMLCDSYWKALPSYEPGDRLSNAELTLIEKRGDRSWLTQIKAHKHLRSGEQAVLRRSESGNSFWPELSGGQLLRVTDVVLSIKESADISVLNLTMLSEALFMSK